MEKVELMHEFIAKERGQEKWAFFIVVTGCCNNLLWAHHDLPLFSYLLIRCSFYVLYVWAGFPRILLLSWVDLSFIYSFLV